MIGQLAARTRIGVVTDVDGTISPIAPTPAEAQVTPTNLELLRRLRERVALVAVISGRAPEDVAARVGLSGVVYVGNHGLEWLDSGQIISHADAAAARPALEQVIEAIKPHLLPGMLLEDKRVTLSIHYRLADDPERVEAAFDPLLRAVVADAGDLDVFAGRMIFEVRPHLQVNKGTAFRQLVTEYRLDGAVYLGDDTTDASALYIARALREAGECYALAVGVASAETPDAVRAASDWLVDGVGGVEAFFTALLEAL